MHRHQHIVRYLVFWCDVLFLQLINVYYLLAHIWILNRHRVHFYGKLGKTRVTFRLKINAEALERDYAEDGQLVNTVSLEFSRPT